MRCINCMRERKDGGGVCPYCGFDADKYKPPNDALPPGSVLNGGKYVVGRVLGRGGFGITYVALDQNLGLRVAIKECMPQREARRDADGVSAQWLVPEYEQERARENFLREAQKLAKIYGIPGVVPVREYFDDNKTTYIVMDYVEGETLAQRLRRTGPMSAAECFRLLSPVMDTLEQAHKLQIDGESVIHRDIKPNNIMIGRIKGGDERVWLLDLGAAKDLGARDFAPNVSVESRPVGTPGYMPPEQYSPDGRIGSWTDVYALSATFFYCMTGKKPPDSQSRSSELREPEVLLSVPGAVGDVLRKGMALHREERYQTMKELRDALEKALPKPKPKRPKWIPALVALLTVIVLAVLFVKTPFKPAIIPETENEPLEDIALSESVGVSENEPSAEIVDSGECGENASWTLDADGLLTISGSGKMDDYIYDLWNAPWRDYRGAILSVKIEGIAYIGVYAFNKCEKLQSADISDSVTAIGDFAFNWCRGLSAINIPNSVTTIGRDAFQMCKSLKSITIPDSVTSIGESAFITSGLTSVSLPDSVTMVAEHTFSQCDNLKSVSLPDSVTEIGSGAFSNCYSLESIDIPDSVTTIGKYAFQSCSSLSSVSVPKNTVIADGAFDENTTVIRRDAKIIDSGECGESASWTLNSDGLLTISGSGKMDDYIYDLWNAPWRDYRGAILSVKIEGIDYIGVYAFNKCEKLQSADISDSVTAIGDYAFNECRGLSAINIPDSVTSIGKCAFQICKSLKSITIPDSVTSIGEFAFNLCGLTSVSIPNSVTMIAKGTFMQCRNLKSVSIPDSVTEIGPSAFSNCDNLESINIPDSVTIIGKYAFHGCSSLLSVSVPAGATIADDAFDENTTVRRVSRVTLSTKIAP